MADIKPPFTAESALKKVKAAQNLWNSKDPQRVAQAYTPDTIWRNRNEFMCGREEVIEFLTKKWQKENGYKLRKDLFAFMDNRIAVQFFYEWYEEKENGEKQWYRTYGLEDWTFESSGLMKKRQMSGNDVTITEQERWFKEGVDVDQLQISDKHL
ncbi:NTF2-like domain superfamily protein [Abortiporus biennis]